jgi:hypothetical protein
MNDLIHNIYIYFILIFIICSNVFIYLNNRLDFCDTTILCLIAIGYLANKLDLIN